MTSPAPLRRRARWLHTVRRHLLAVLAALFSAGATRVASSVLPGAQFLFVLSAFVPVAWYLGRGASIVYSIAVVVALDWWVIPPFYSLEPSSPSALVPLALFLLLTFFIGRLTQAVHDASDLAEQSAQESRQLAAQLEQQSLEIEARAEDLVRTRDELRVVNARLQLANDELAVKTTLAERARDEAQHANRAKSDFLAMMSHELRTPLNAIAGYIDLLALGVRGPLNDQQLQDLGRVRRSQQHLLALINNVLNFAKLEAGHVRFDLRRTPLDAALREVEELVAPQLLERRITFRIDGCDPDVRVWADHEKLRQILLNLLSNAIKFTSSGGRIDLGCDVRHDRVDIHVRDTGCGIPPHQLDRVFEPFVQLDRALTSLHQGTGLGLAISRDLARRMGGDLTVASAVGAGSTFTITLTREPPKESRLETAMVAAELSPAAEDGSVPRA